MKRACSPLKRAAYRTKNQAGLYRFYDSKGSMIYVGTSKVMRHRLQSYLQKDDFGAHRTKEVLRRKIRCVRVEYMPIKKARRIEMSAKHNGRYNYA